MRIIGVDPGNSLSGISYWEDGTLVASEVLCPWTTLPTPPIGWFRGRVNRVYVEVPQNGTHASRGGVQWAGGMVVASLLPLCSFSRGTTRKVKPSEWRKGLDLPEKGEKAVYIEAARAYGFDGTDDNEAEAVLIGAYGAGLMRK